MDGEEPGPFRFPEGMTREEAERLLAEAYAEVDTGKVLRRTLRQQRARGLDPPMDVQYASEARVEDHEGGLSVSVVTDILLYEEFAGMDACTDIFEEVLVEALLDRLERKLHAWQKRRPR